MRRCCAWEFWFYSAPKNRKRATSKNPPARAGMPPRAGRALPPEREHDRRQYWDETMRLRATVKRGLIALLLSLGVPGLGQIYNARHGFS